MLPPDLRPYQEFAIEKLRDAIRQGHKHIICQSPTGSGKTEISIMMICEAMCKGTHTAFICDRLAILNQTETRFVEHELDFGVIQSGHYRYNPDEFLQLCSSQTLGRRGIGSEFKLIIVDEAHTRYRTTTEFLKRHPNTVAIGLTATGFTKGLGDVYSHVVNVTTTDELIAQGWLAPVRAYAAKRISLKGVKIVNDEYDEKEVTKRSMVIVGDVVHEWVKATDHHFGGPVKTLVFSASVAHGEELCRQFQAAGYNFQQVSYKDGNDSSRKALIDEFRKPRSEVVGLISVEALAKGFDVPDVKMGVGCRPYNKSFSSHIQAVGRVMRPDNNKSFAVWNCHCGNYEKFLPDMLKLYAEGVPSLRESNLDTKVRKDTETTPSGAKCVGCGYILSPKDETCPSCGTARPKRTNRTEHAPGKMVEVGGKNVSKAKIWTADEPQIIREIWGYTLPKKNGDMVKARKFATAQFMSIYQRYPDFSWDKVVPAEPRIELMGKIRHNLIRYFKGHARRV